VNTGEELLAVEGLSQVRDRAESKCGISVRIIIMCGHNDDRQFPLLIDHPLLELLAGHPWKTQVKHQAALGADRSGGKELLGGCEEPHRHL